jgi:SAM-dependent methyltransferase
MSERYLECISGAELERLHSQHNAWLPETVALLKDAGFSSARRVLEVGCGPGFTSLEIATSLNPRASVTAVDISEYYLNHLRQEISAKAITNVSVVNANLMDEVPDIGQHDAAFCRWFLAWVTRGMDQALSNVHRSLRAGGIFACMEYLTLRSVCHSPPCSESAEYVRAWEEFYNDCGGTTEVGGVLPGKLREHGFEVVEMRCVGGYAPLGHRLYEWWRRLFEDFHLRFSERGLLSPKAIDSLKLHWQRCEQDQDAFIYTPILVQIIARKK